MMMEIIHFAYTDMWNYFNPEWFRLTKILKKKYDRFFILAKRLA